MTSTPPAASRIVVVGDSGSGKTTVASGTARTLGDPACGARCVVHEAGWQQADPEVFRQRVAQVAAQDAWVADGNYSGRVEICCGRVPRPSCGWPCHWRSRCRASCAAR